MMHYTDNVESSIDDGQQQQQQYGNFNNYHNDASFNSRLYAATNIASRLVSENSMMNNATGPSGYRDPQRDMDRDFRRDRERDRFDQDRPRRDRDQGGPRDDYNSGEFFNYENRSSNSNNLGGPGNRMGVTNSSNNQQSFGNFDSGFPSDNATPNGSYGYYGSVDLDGANGMTSGFGGAGASKVAPNVPLDHKGGMMMLVNDEPDKSESSPTVTGNLRRQRSNDERSGGGSNDGYNADRGNNDSWSDRRRRDYDRDRDGRGRDRDSRDRGRDWEGRSGNRDRDGGRSRDRDRERGRDRDRNSRDRSRGRDRSPWDRNSRGSGGRERSFDRDRERGGRDRSERDEWERDMDYQREHYQQERNPNAWRKETPNHTVMVGGLPMQATVKHIVDDVAACGLEIKDIRLIKKGDTGSACGFAFIEFKSVGDATQWMETKQGFLRLYDQNVQLHYSFPKGVGTMRFDWDCGKCGAHNFRRRLHCFKCMVSREDAEQFVDGYEDVSSVPKNTLLLRNLDTLTNEDEVLRVIQKISAIPIKTIRVAKDPLTGTSRGFCYVELNSVLESVRLFNELQQLPFPMVVNNRAVALSYSLQSISGSPSATRATVASTAVAAAQWINQVPAQGGTADPYGGNSGNASSYAAASDGTSYAASSVVTSYTPHGLQDSPAMSSAARNRGGSSNYQTEAGDGAVNVLAGVNSSKHAEAVPSNAVVASAAPTEYKDTSRIGVPNAYGEYTKFPIPDVSTYQFDQSTNYYYDPATGLYYDANSQYYYNSQTQQFLYWDGTLYSYLPAPTEAGAGALTGDASATGAAEDQADTAGGKKPKDKEKSDKVKIAKKIAKDMEKWAKMLNQKKENAKQGYVANQALAPDSLYKQPATADAGFAILEKRSTLAERQAAIFEAMKKEADPKRGSGPGKAGGVDGSLVPQYSGGSDTDDDGTEGGGGSGPLDENRLVDWQKLACLLCKRQFPTKDALTRHQQLSDLHKQNLEALQKAQSAGAGQRGGGGGGGGGGDDDDQEGGGQYRDRARERREKYGEPEVPPPTKMKEKFGHQKTINYEEPTKHGIDSSNIGNKMLKAMGWNEGQGLGKANQGRTQIVEATKRVTAAGLGLRGSTYGAAAGDSYKETVKKLMQTRYNELE